MFKFRKERDRVVLEYTVDYGGNSWVADELEKRGMVTISRTFNFELRDLLEPLPANPDELEDLTYKFHFATREDGYLRVEGRIFDISNTVFISDAGIKLERRLFAAHRDISIIPKIAELVGDEPEIVIGGSRPGAIPTDVYEDLLKRFPNTTELSRYAAARVSTILGDHIEPLRDAREQYERYLERRSSKVKSAVPSQSELLDAEIQKYVYIRDTIIAWLEKADSHSEKEWQKMIVNFLLLIFPKYIAILENVTVADYYSSPGKLKHRYIDLALVDAGGNLDLIEVKKPFDNALVAKTKYRDNSVPAKELAGSIMQAEKYLFHLSKWGTAGEKKITAAHAAKLPPGLEVRITTPKAMIIVGRDRLANGTPALKPDQAFDLEVIKRKYANMMDIMTYDDLLRRLENIISSLKARVAAA